MYIQKNAYSYPISSNRANKHLNPTVRLIKQFNKYQLRKNARLWLVESSLAGSRFEYWTFAKGLTVLSFRNQALDKGLEGFVSFFTFLETRRCYLIQIVGYREIALSTESAPRNWEVEFTSVQIIYEIVGRIVIASRLEE